MTEMNEEVIEAQATPVEPPRVLGEADRWLAEKRAEVEEALRDSGAFEIADAQGYKDSKRQRTAVRAAASRIDGERKAMTAQLTAALKDFKAQADEVLAPLTALDADLKAEQGKWEAKVVEERMARLAEAYEDGHPDAAARAPFPKLRERYGAEGKWAALSTTPAKAAASVEAAATDVEQNLGTIAATYEGGERLSAEADYLRDLDFSRFLHQAAEREAYRKRLEREQEERERWEREEAARAAQAAAEYAPAEAQGAAEGPEQPAPAPAPAQAAAAPETAAEAAKERVLVFEVYVPEERAREFIGTMRALGVHGRKVGERDV